MKCSICNRDRKDLSMMVNLKTQETDYICSDCLASNNYEKTSLEEVKLLLEIYNELLKSLEDLLRNPDVYGMKVPKGLEALAMTPKKIYEMSLKEVTTLKMRKLELESQMPQKDFLERDLAKAIEKEDYERAIVIREQLKTFSETKKNGKQKIQENKIPKDAMIEVFLKNLSDITGSGERKS